jgi:hypothetical protein
LPSVRSRVTFVFAMAPSPSHGPLPCPGHPYSTHTILINSLYLLGRSDLLQSFEQLLQTGVQCGVPARDLNRWLLFLSTATILFARKARQGNPTSITITITFPHGYPQFSHDLHRPNSTHLLFYLYTHASDFRALHLPLLV